MNKLTLLTTLFWLTTLTSGCSTVLTATSSGPIEENYATRTWGAYVDDKLIETKATVNINKANPGFETAHIVLNSYNGYVLLAGQVKSAQLKDLAGNIIKNIRKVRRVHNELTVSGPTSQLSRTNDGWLTSKIKAQMIAENEFPSSNVRVVTENGVVYLMGLVTHKQADIAVAIARRSYGVQKIVKIFEYLD